MTIDLNYRREIIGFVVVVGNTNRARACRNLQSAILHKYTLGTRALMEVTIS